MCAQFLIPQTTLVGNGTGQAIALGSAQGATLQLTLVIESIVEQQSLDIHIDGSPLSEQASAIAHQRGGRLPEIAVRERTVVIERSHQGLRKNRRRSG